MKEYTMLVKHDEIITSLKKMVQNDYESIDLIVDVEIEASKYNFKLLYPDKTIWVKEIIDGKITLPVLTNSGNYQYEVSCYDEKGRLTSTAIGSFYVRSELVKTDEEVQRDDRLPILDDLINQVNDLDVKVNENEEIRQENEEIRQTNEEERKTSESERKEYYQEIQRKVEAGEFNGKDALINGINTINIVAGENISLRQDGSTLEINAKDDEAYNYEKLYNLPSVNGVELKGNKTSEDLGIFPYDDSQIKIDIDSLKNDTSLMKSQIKGLTDDVTQISEDMEYLALVDETGNRIALDIDSKTYQLKAKLYNKNGRLISESEIIDLPLESVVMNVEYDKETKEIIITLESGEQTRVPVGELVKGLVSEKQLAEELKPYAKTEDLEEVEHLINEDQKRQDKEIEELINILPKNTASGVSELSYDNALEYNVFESKIKGNHKQDGEPSPQNPQEIETLKTINLYNKYIPSTDVYYDGNGRPIHSSSEYVNGSIQTNNFRNILISYEEKIGDGYVRICEYKQDGSFIKRTLINTNNYILALNEATNKIIYSVENSGTVYFDDLQILLGTEAKPYLPYGCIFKKHIDKNFWNKNEEIQTTNLVPWGIYLAKPNANFKLKPGTYTLALKIKSNNGSILNKVILRDSSNQDKITYTPYKEIPTIFKQYVYNPFTINEETEFSGILIQNGPTQETYTLSEIMILSGSYTNENLPKYEPYQERKQLIKLGDYELLEDDEIITDRKGNNKLIKRWGKIVLDGSEFIETIDSPTRFRINKRINSANSTKQISSHYVYGEWGNIDNSFDIRDNGIRINNKDNLSLTEFKSFLATNKPVFYYELAEPQIIELEPSEPIKTFEGVNNVSVEANLEPTYMEETYAVDTQKQTSNVMLPQIMNADGNMTPADVNNLDDGLYYFVKPVYNMYQSISLTGLVSINHHYVNAYDYNAYFSDFNGTTYTDYGHNE